MASMQASNELIVPILKESRDWTRLTGEIKFWIETAHIWEHVDPKGNLELFEPQMPDWASITRGLGPKPAREDFDTPADFETACVICNEKCIETYVMQKTPSNQEDDEVLEKPNHRCLIAPLPSLSHALSTPLQRLTVLTANRFSTPSSERINQLVLA